MSAGALVGNRDPRDRSAHEPDTQLRLEALDCAMDLALTRGFDEGGSPSKAPQRNGASDVTREAETIYRWLKGEQATGEVITGPRAVAP